jgi:hypothetical protein
MLSGSLIVMAWRVLSLWTEETWLLDMEGRCGYNENVDRGWFSGLLFVRRINNSFS